MKKLLLILCMIAGLSNSYAQSSKLNPGEKFKNQTADTLYIIPTKQLKSLFADAVSYDINMTRLKLYQQKICRYEEQLSLFDSTIHIKEIEADYWHQQLLQNDQLLENQRIENLRLIDDKNRIRQSRVYYWFAGILAGAVFISL